MLDLSMNDFWNSKDENTWASFDLEPKQVGLEKEMATVNFEDIKKLSPEEFYNWLYEKYFVWKYTDKRRLANTRNHLEKHNNAKGYSFLGDIQSLLFSFNKDNIKIGLVLANQINGLGTAGASGLLAVLFPNYFGTVDQFVVKALKNIDEYKDEFFLQKINPDDITINQGVYLVEIMKKKTMLLNANFNNNYWTPRKIDKVLWSLGKKQ